MNFSEETIWLANQASSGLLYFGWVTAILLSLIVFTAWFQRKRIIEKGIKAFWLGLPVTGVVFILLSASALKQKPEFGWMPYVGLAITVALSGVAVWKFRGARFFASTTSALILWYGIWCAFVSIMSITDVWV